MKHLSRAVLPALALATVAAVSPAEAMGQLPIPIGDRTVPTPAPIAGGGLVWLGLAAGVGVYLWIRRRRGSQ